MEIKVGVDGCKVTMELSGKLTVQTSPALSEKIDELAEDVCDLDIDLAAVDYIASAGLRVLVAADKLAVRRGGHMRLLNPNDEVMDVFEMTGLSEVFAIER